MLVGLAALLFWVVGVGAGLRGWILTEDDWGIVAHAQGFGLEAFVWWIPASVLTLTAVVMAIGTSVVRHLVDGPVDSVPAVEPKPQKPTKQAVPPKTEKPELKPRSSGTS